MKTVNWKTAAATNDAGSRAEARALADRLASTWKQSSQATAGYHCNHRTHPDYSGRKFSQKPGR